MKVLGECVENRVHRIGAASRNAAMTSVGRWPEENVEIEIPAAKSRVVAHRSLAMMEGTIVNDALTI